MEVSTSRPTQADRAMQDNQVQPNQQTTCNEPPRYDNHSSILTWGNLLNVSQGQSTACLSITIVYTRITVR
jgi:hypothetical protein